jgi:hypothetical protein
VPRVLNLLERLLESPDALLTGDDFKRIDDGLGQYLLDAKVLTQAKTANHVVCDGCHDGHVEEVERVCVKGFPTGFFIRCPEAGWVSIHPDRLRQWKLNVAQLATVFAVAIRKDAVAEAIMHNMVWRLGEIEIAGATFGIVMVIARKCDSADLVPRIGQSFPPDKTVLVTVGVSTDVFSAFAAAMPLASAFRLDQGGVQLDANRIRASLCTNIAAPANIFRLRGQFWELVYDGKTAYMKDSVGLAYLARILVEPDRDIPAVSLLAACAGIDPLVASGSLGEVLDAETRRNYENRYRDLQEELAEAHDFNDLGRSERIERELDQLTTELASATGLGGRTREKSDVDKVRKSVSMAVSRAIESIEAEHESLARHLQGTISSGRTFRYAPPDAIDWLI